MIRINFPTGYQVMDLNNDNIDILIILEGGMVYAITAFTTENIAKLMKDNAEHFFWGTDMVIFSDLKIETIKEGIREMQEGSLFEDFFEPIGNIESVFGKPPVFGDLYYLNNPSSLKVED